ncbi:MAG: hypothetical protein Q9163_000604 [Psora crenata]
MIARVSLARHGRQTLWSCRTANGRRRLATVASGTFSYETGDAAGVKVASRDFPGPTTHLAVVAKAGTRFQPLPGFSDGLEKFAFKSTYKRSALRITRESELLGGQLSASHSRENLVISTRFLRDDLPYFAELLGEVISQTRYTGGFRVGMSNARQAHELQEEVNAVIGLSRKALLGNTTEFAFNSVHGVAFHRGLGNPLHPSSSTPMTKYLQEDLLRQYSQVAYAKPNIAVVANGASHQDMSKWVGQFFTECHSSLPPDSSSEGTSPSKYYGGEERVAHDSGNTMILAFPGSSSFTGGSYKPEMAVLAALLGGRSNIKWSSGFSLLSKATEAYPQAHISTTHHTYSDAGLLTVCISGNARHVRDASREVVIALKDTAAGKVSSEDIKKARATAKFQALESGQNIDTGIELTGAGLIQEGKAFQIDEVGKGMDDVSEAQVKKDDYYAGNRRYSYSMKSGSALCPGRMEEIGILLRQICFLREVAGFGAPIIFQDEVILIPSDGGGGGGSAKSLEDREKKRRVLKHGNSTLGSAFHLARPRLNSGLCVFAWLRRQRMPQLSSRG